MKKLIFLLLLALPFFGFSQAAYLMEFTNPNGSKVVFNLNDVRSCVAEGTGSYLFTRTGSGKTQVQESPATIATNSCGNIVLFTVYSPANQFNDTKQMGVNPNYVVGVVSNTSGNGVLKMITPTENFTTTSTYNAAVALLSICVSGGGGGGSLTNTYVGFGDGLNQLDGEAGFTYDAESNRLAVDTVKTKRITSKSGDLELDSDLKFDEYPNSRNDTGNPVNLLTTSSSGGVESHPVSDLRDSLLRHFWGLKGNAGTTPGTDFIGTTDAKDIYFKRNSLQIGRFGESSTHLGYLAGDKGSQTNTVFIGPFAGKNATSASLSNFIGYAAGEGATNAERSNFIGYLSGNAATGASYSTFIGYGSGSAASNAYFSSFVGINSGTGATNAFNSVFIGPNAGSQATASNDNVSIGNESGMQGKGINSVFIGPRAGKGTINANNSIFIGREAGLNDVVVNASSGTDNSILIGNYSGTGGFNNSIAIGYQGINTKSNQVLIANSYTELKANNFVVNTSDAPTNNQVLTFKSATGQANWENRGGSQFQKFNVSATSVDVSASPSAGFVALTSGQISDIAANPSLAQVWVNGVLHDYVATPSATTNLSFNFSGTVLSAFSGTSPVTINQIRVKYEGIE